MIIKAEQLEQIWTIIDKLKNKVFSIETQYKFIKLYKRVIEEMDIIDAQREMIIEQFGERDARGEFITDGRGVKIKQESIQQCEQKIKELNNLQIQIPDIYFSIDELSELGLELQELMLLDNFIKI